MTFLELKPLTAEQLPAVVELDHLCFGGLWTLEGYRKELLSPNSDILVLELTSNDFGLESRAGETHETLELQEQLYNPKSAFPSGILGTSQNPKSLVGLGCFWSILDEAHITLLAVHPDYRREGMGFLLLAAMLRLARYRGLDRATLEVKVSNQAALSLYQKLDFQEAGRRRRYYKDTGEDALILWCGGLQTPEFEQKLAGWQISVGDRLEEAGWQIKEVGINPKV